MACPPPPRGMVLQCRAYCPLHRRCCGIHGCCAAASMLTVLSTPVHPLRYHLHVDGVSKPSAPQHFLRPPPFPPPTHPTCPEPHPPNPGPRRWWGT